MERTNFSLGRLARLSRMGMICAIVGASGYGALSGARAGAQNARTIAARDTVVFAGGCFWSMQKAFDHVAGVTSTTAGYSGGRVANPSYEEVETAQTGHAESVQVVYDPSKLSYNALINAYWHSIDPTDGGGTFCDRGPQYRPIIFVRDSAHQRVAVASKAVVSKLFDKPIAVQFAQATPFYPAEEYHQAYYKKNPERYDAYRRGCGRDKDLAEAWAKAKK
jgi:peptide-methionine (S)-S-oxide reductase